MRYDAASGRKAFFANCRRAIQLTNCFLCKSWFVRNLRVLIVHVLGSAMSSGVCFSETEFTQWARTQGMKTTPKVGFAAYGLVQMNITEGNYSTYRRRLL